MKKITTEAHITSTPTTVWETLIKLENWSVWNPIVSKVQGDPVIGKELTITMADSKGNANKSYKAQVTELVQNQRFVFTANMMTKFLFSAKRVIELKATETGTLLIQQEIYTGVLVPLFWKKLSTDAKTMLNQMNHSLKKEVEQS